MKRRGTAKQAQTKLSEHELAMIKILTKVAVKKLLRDMCEKVDKELPEIFEMMGLNELTKGKK